MSRPVIYIEVKGGTIQDIKSNSTVDFIIVDRDNQTVETHEILYELTTTEEIEALQKSAESLYYEPENDIEL